uniref:Uncharacterized protein n=1 Tax=Cacopsylla melanoneura TaxID=428564 RepID=A0A8D8RF27_9HEMI
MVDVLWEMRQHRILMNNRPVHRTFDHNNTEQNCENNGEIGGETTSNMDNLLQSVLEKLHFHSFNVRKSHFQNIENRNKIPETGTQIQYTKELKRLSACVKGEDVVVQPGLMYTEIKIPNNE